MVAQEDLDRMFDMEINTESRTIDLISKFLDNTIDICDLKKDEKDVLKEFLKVLLHDTEKHREKVLGLKSDSKKLKGAQVE